MKLLADEIEALQRHCAAGMLLAAEPLGAPGRGRLVRLGLLRVLPGGYVVPTEAGVREMRRRRPGFLLRRALRRLAWRPRLLWWAG